MTRSIRTRPRPIVAAALTAWLAGLALLTPAYADDTLDRQVRFSIPAAPLGKALVEFSAQSGIQIAVAYAEVSQRQSAGLIGDYLVQDALNTLLKDTGLQFFRVGSNTLAIRSVGAGPPLGNSATGGAPAPAASASNATASGGTGSPQFPDVHVIDPRRPTEQELAGGNLSQFVVHHGTSVYSSGTGSITDWKRDGLEA